MKLYEIPAALRQAFDAIEVDEETGEIFGAQTLDEIEGAAAMKIENAGLYVRELFAEAEAVKAEADRLTKRKKALENRAERIKWMMLPAVQAMGGKVKGELLTVSIGKTKSVELDPDALDLLPFAFVRVKKEVDKRALGDALKAGQEFGCARLIEKQSIRMR